MKEEHSVLKDKVRDLEQMTENEEKQIKSKIADIPGDHNTHTCLASGICPNASADLSCAEHREYLENKYCHRRDGQCVCYYCTIFGHTVGFKRFIFVFFSFFPITMFNLLHRNTITVVSTRLVIVSANDCISKTPRFRLRLLLLHRLRHRQRHQQ